VPEALPDAGGAADAAARAALARADAAVVTPAEPPSPFAIVLRGPYTWQGCPLDAQAYVGCAPPLVHRLPGGGLVFAVEFARARADGPGAPFTVELMSRGLEIEALYRSVITQSPAAFRWVWSDDAATVLVDERDYMRSGPQMETRKLGPKGFSTWKSGAGMWSAVARDGSVIALERVVREIPNSSLYPKGSEYYANQSEIRPAKVTVLAGKGPPPVIPSGVCPLTMSAGPDGTLVVAVEKCGDAEKRKLGALRYPPKATAAKVEWLGDYPREESGKDVLAAAAAAGPSAIWVAIGSELHTWDGKAWSATKPFGADAVRSLSPAPSGELWAVLGEGKLVKRERAGAAWTEVALPRTPDDPLDPQAWAVPTYNRPAFVPVKRLVGNEVVRSEASGMDAQMVDAQGGDVVVLARAAGEAFLLSTAPRGAGAVARLPSHSVQRARIAAAIPREEAGARGPGGKPRDCKEGFLVFPEGTSASAVKAVLAPLRVDAGAPSSSAARSADAGPPPPAEELEERYVDPSPRLADGLVEGRTRLIVWATDGLPDTAQKALAAFAPKRLCGPVVIARDL
jgi:hypothetical protein